jgi:outer membrane protein TolC
MRERWGPAVLVIGWLVQAAGAGAQTVTQGSAAPPIRVTFDEAVRLAIEKNPTMAEAAQAILRADVLLQLARTVERPIVSGSVTATVLDSERGFDGQVTQPQTQAFLGASISFPVLAASRWAQRAQAQDQIQIAQLSVTEVRRQIAVAAAQAYLEVIALQRQVEVGLLARENAQAHVDFARARLEGGMGSKLNELRASQELATDEVFLEAARLGVRRAQEALGVLIAADAPVDVAGEPSFEVPAMPADEAWLGDRSDVRLFTAQVGAADRVLAFGGP